MFRRLFIIQKLEETTYLPAPEINEPEGISRRVVTFRSNEPEEERDEIIAVLWDGDTILSLNEGDEVLATLQFKIGQKIDGSSYQYADVVEIKKVRDYYPW